MKKLILLWLFSGSLDCFCQTSGTLVNSVYREPDLTPDTIRATLIVYYDRGPAILHTNPGYVVRKYGDEDVYLDDKKRIVKSPMEVFSYKLKK